MWAELTNGVTIDKHGFTLLSNENPAGGLIQTDVTPAYTIDVPVNAENGKDADAASLLLGIP